MRAPAYWCRSVCVCRCKCVCVCARASVSVCLCVFMCECVGVCLRVWGRVACRVGFETPPSSKFLLVAGRPAEICVCVPHSCLPHCHTRQALEHAHTSTHTQSHTVSSALYRACECALRLCALVYVCVPEQVHALTTHTHTNTVFEHVAEPRCSEAAAAAQAYFTPALHSPDRRPRLLQCTQRPRPPGAS